MHSVAKEFIKQPIEGMLYDLNRNEVTVLTLIEDPKWVNDYAVSKVIQELKLHKEHAKALAMHLDRVLINWRLGNSYDEKSAEETEIVLNEYKQIQ